VFASGISSSRRSLVDTVFSVVPVLPRRQDLAEADWLTAREHPTTCLAKWAPDFPKAIQGNSTVESPYDPSDRLLSMGRRIPRYLLLSQISFFALLAVCLAIFPRFLFARDEGGVSNYGVKASTEIPFTLAFLLCSIFILKAAHITPTTPPILERFRKALFTLAALFLLLLASTFPYKINVLLKDIHIITGVLLISFELAMSVWLTVSIVTNRTSVLLLAIQASGCLLALITLVGLLHLLFLAQLIASAAFGVLLVSVGHQLVQRYGFGQQELNER